MHVVVVSHIQRSGCQPETIYGSMWLIVSHIQRIGCQPETTALHCGGQSQSWSAEQGYVYICMYSIHLAL